MSYTDVLCMSVPTPELWISTRGLPSTDVQSTNNKKNKSIHWKFYQTQQTVIVHPLTTVSD